MDARERVVDARLRAAVLPGRQPCDRHLSSPTSATRRPPGDRPARSATRLCRMSASSSAMVLRRRPSSSSFVPLLLLAPLPRPAASRRAGVLATRPGLRAGRWHRDRWLTASPTRGPASARSRARRLRPRRPSLAHIAGLPAGARRPSRHRLRAGPCSATGCSTACRSERSSAGCAGTKRVAAILSPVAFFIALAAVEEPLVLLALIAPLVWLLTSSRTTAASAGRRRSSCTAPTAAP